MNRNFKTYWIYGIIIGLIAVMGIAIYQSFLESYRKLDETMIRDETTQIKYTLEQIGDALIERAVDWATWDDTYRYVQGKDDAFVTRELLTDSFAVLGVDAAIFLDRDQRPLASALVSLDRASVTPISAASFQTFIDDFTSAPSSQGWAYSTFDNRLAIYAWSEVKDSAGTSDPRGYFIVMREIDRSIVPQIAKILKLPVRSTTATQMQGPSWIALDEKTIAHATPTHMEVFLPFNNRSGMTLGSVEIDIPRKVFMQGQSHLFGHMLLLGVGAIMLLLGLAAHLKLVQTRMKMDHLSGRNAEIERQNDYLKALVSSVPGFVSWFDEGLTYLGVNDRLAEELKMKPLHIIGQRVGFNDADEASVFTQEVIRFAKSIEPTRTAEVFMLIKGEPRKMLLSMAKYDHLSKFVVIGIDITKAHELQLDNIRQQERVFNSTRLASLGQMAGGVAHEINSPLSIILAASEQLQAHLGANSGDQKSQKLLEKIARTTERIAKIVSGLRTFARDGDRDDIVTAKALDIVNDTLDLCREKFRSHGVEVRVVIGEDFVLLCRPVQIGQVLVNLLNNAYDAVCEAKDPWIQLSVTKTDHFCEIAVEDSGEGIDPETLKKIMDPFFTTKPVGKGTGLGLSISKSIAEDHGGSLRYDDMAKNTRFILRLPIQASNKNIA